MKSTSSFVQAFITASGETVKDPNQMCEMAANYYEDFFSESSIIRPHPYTDSPFDPSENEHEIIPEIQLDELIETVHVTKKKNSTDAHGISSVMIDFLDQSHWTLLLNLFNRSLEQAYLPKAWKDSRMILLAKKRNHLLP